MNPLLQHKTLQHLPRELLKNPNRQQIRGWLDKKVRIFRRIRIVSLAFIPIIIAYQYFRPTGHSAEKGQMLLDSVGDVLQLMMFPMLAILFYILERQYRISDEEVSNTLGNFFDGQGPPA